MKKLVYLLTLLLVTVIGANGQLTSGIAAYWKLDETSGSTVNDSYSSNDGTVTNATINQTGILGNGVSFDGSGDYILCGNSSSLDIGTSDWSFSCWFKTTATLSSSSNLYTIFSNGSSTTAGIDIILRGGTPWNGILVRLCDGSSYYDFKPESDISSTINNGAWHHLAVTIDRDGDLVIYLDNSVVKTQSITSYWAKNFHHSFEHRIGILNYNYSFDGILDEIGIWNKALTTSEVSQLYNSGNGLSYPFGGNAQYTISTFTTGSGSVTLSPSGGTYDAGTVVTVTATQSSGYQFSSWSGDLSGSTNPATVTMNSNKSITATFTELPPDQYSLSTSVTGSGSIVLSPSGGTYSSGTAVTLTAVPGSGYEFIGWSGDLSGSTNPTTLVMNNNKSVTATFTGNGGGDSYWDAATGGGITYDGDVSIGGVLNVNGEINNCGWNYSEQTIQANVPYSQTEYYRGIHFNNSKMQVAGIGIKGSDYTMNYMYLGFGNVIPDMVSGMFIRSNGNVGIGCENPQTKLSVNGTITASRIDVVETVPCSDDVFETDYKLMNLHELDAFIKTNKHLPEVPSAEEFKENGYSVGEMDDLLLRKIEELTLYVIELEKKQELLRYENEKLKSIKGNKVDLNINN